MFHSFLFLALSEVIFNISNYIVQVGQARILGNADYGRVTLVVSFMTMLTILIGRGIPTAMSKRLSEHTDDLATIKAIRKKAALLQLLIITIITTLVFFAAPAIALAFRDPTLTPLFRAASFMIPAFSLSAFYVQYFNGLKDFRGMSILKTFRGLVRVFFVLYGAYFFGLIGAIAGAILAPFTLSLIAFIIDHVRHKDLATVRTTKNYPKKLLLNYAGGFMFFLFLYEFYIRTDLYLIKFFTGDDTLVGLYNAALTLTLIPYYLCIALALLLFPTISTLSKNAQKKELHTLLTTVLRFLWIILIPLAGLLAFYAPQIIALLFGENFLRSAHIIPLMVGGSVFWTFFYILTTIFNGADRTKYSIFIVSAGIITTVLLNSYFLPRYGIWATALIFSCTSFLLASFSLYTLYKFLNVTIPPKTLFLAPLITLLLYIPAAFLPDGTWTFLLSAGVLFVSYVGIMIFFGMMTAQDFSAIARSKKEI